MLSFHLSVLPPRHVYTLTSSIISPTEKKKKKKKRGRRKEFTSQTRPYQTSRIELEEKKKKQDKTRQNIVTPYFPYLESPRCQKTIAEMKRKKYLASSLPLCKCTPPP